MGLDDENPLKSEKECTFYINGTLEMSNQNREQDESLNKCNVNCQHIENTDEPKDVNLTNSEPLPNLSSTFFNHSSFDEICSSSAEKPNLIKLNNVKTQQSLNFEYDSDSNEMRHDNNLPLKKQKKSNNNSSSNIEDSSSGDEYPYSESENVFLLDQFNSESNTPQKIIVVKGLSKNITQQEIIADILNCGLHCKDVQIINEKHTGEFNGFAIVEFFETVHAISWMDIKKGILTLKDETTAFLQYSIPKKVWSCMNCNCNNFERKKYCYKCNLSKNDVEVDTSSDEISSQPTNIILLRGLNILTTKKEVLQSLNSITSLPIVNIWICIDKKSDCNNSVQSNGKCYIVMKNVIDAICLSDLLQSLEFKVNGHIPSTSYTKYPTLISEGESYPDQTSLPIRLYQQKPDARQGKYYKLEDVPKLASYTASIYATSEVQKESYTAFYENYYENQISEGNRIILPSSTTMFQDNFNFYDDKSFIESPLLEPPDGRGDRTYSIPDVTTYQLDKTSGYYYDPYTTLYYDSNSRFYYNNKLSKFLYWDGQRCTFLPVQEKVDHLKESKKEKDLENDKVRAAKRIAKDMEKWAKTLNQKKEINKLSESNQLQTITSNDCKITDKNISNQEIVKNSDKIINSEPYKVQDLTNNKNEGIISVSGIGSDSDNDDEIEAKSFIAEIKLVCLLCKRKFKTKEILFKHEQLSDLHKKNLTSWYKARGIDCDDSNQKQAQQTYRDRAKERRLKYNNPSTPQQNHMKESYMKIKEAQEDFKESSKIGIQADNVGNKLLQKMGWQEGMGLGKSNQGRTSIIIAEHRVALAGLGSKSVGVTPRPGESYKDCVKKMMQARYDEVSNRQ